MNNCNFTYQLLQTTYPDNPEMNVKYQYGAPNSGNETGRLIYQEDATGIQQFKYGKLGELTENIRTFVLPDQQIYTFAMQWQYDTWNRIKQITYADGEVVSYGYNRTGMLFSMDGVKGNNTYSYLKEQGYNKFGSKNMMKYGNDITTFYEYSPSRQRLSKLYALDQYGDTVQNILYSYDANNNITYVRKSAERGVGGLPYSSYVNYNYDELNRLGSALGVFYTSSNYEFETDIVYTPSGNISYKWLLASVLTINGNQNIDYSNDYSYSTSKPHALSEINNGDIQYEWTPNGNMKTEYNQVTPNLRRMAWDEENRLNAVLDQDKTLNYYTYDGSGERTLKLTGNMETMNINGQNNINAYLLSNNYTLYTSGYMVINPKLYTKHYYIEGDRIVSKIGGGMELNITPLDSNVYAFDVQSLTDYYSKSDTNNQMMYRFFDSCLVNYDVFVSEDFDWLNDCANKNNTEEDIYFYHKDHLGSSTQITDRNANVIHHMEYLPSGEQFVEQRSTWGTNYKFNSKELDAETGLYYYGARYYTPEIEIWLSVDQLSDDYPHQSPFMFCSGSPVVRVDMNGMSDGWVEDPTNAKKGIYWDSKVNSTKEAEAAGLKYHGQEGWGFNESTGKMIHYKPDGKSNESLNTLAPITIYGLRGSGSVARAMEKSMNQGYDPNWINSFSNCSMLPDYLALSINGNAFLGGGFGGNLTLGWVKGDGGFLNTSFSQGVGVDISWGMGISFGNYIGDNKPTAKLLAGPFSYQNMGTVANITTFQDVSSNNSKLRIGDFWQGGSLNFSFGSKTVWGGSVGTSLTSKPLKLW